MRKGSEDNHPLRQCARVENRVGIYVRTYTRVRTRVRAFTRSMNPSISSRCAHARWKVFNFHATMFYMAVYDGDIKPPGTEEILQSNYGVRRHCVDV
jgi:hypothetical protein